VEEYDEWQEEEEENVNAVMATIDEKDEGTSFFASAVLWVMRYGLIFISTTSSAYDTDDDDDGFYFNYV
jgi:hypothetical protein